MLLQIVVVVALSTLVCARWYTIDSITTLVNITGCSAQVAEEYDLFFEGSYSNFYRSIQNYATSNGHAADIQDFSVQALTDNVKVVSTSVYKPNSKAMRLNVLFSPLKSNIGATKFRFEYTILNFLSTREKTNELTWNTKWKVPVLLVNTTIYYEKPVAAENIQIEAGSKDDIYKSQSTLSVVQKNLYSGIDYDFKVSIPIKTKCVTKSSKSSLVIQILVILGVWGILHLFCRDDVKQREEKRKQLVESGDSGTYSDDDWSVGSADSGGDAD